MAELKLSLVVEAIDRFSAPFRRMRQNLAIPAELGKSLGEGAERLARFSESFAGLAATVGAGFELNDIIKEQDAFTRLGIDAGITAEKTEEVKQSIYGAAQKWGVGIDDLRGAYRGMFNYFTDGKEGIAQTTGALDVLGATMQRLGGYGPQVGQLFGVLERFGGVKGPDELLKGMAMLRAEIGPNSQWMADFAQASAMDLYQYMNRYNRQGQGIAALRDLGAVYSALRPASRTPRQAMTELEQLLDKLVSDPNVSQALQGSGVHILGTTPQEIAANVMAGRGAPLDQWFGEFVKVIQSGDKLPGIELDQLLGPSLRDVISKMKLSDIIAALTASGDPARYLKESAESGDTLASSLTRVGTSLHSIADAYARGPLNEVADALTRFPKVTSAALGTVASVAVLGMFAGWMVRLKPLVTGVGGALASTAAFAGDLFEGIALGLPVLGSLDIALAANPIGAVVAGAVALAGAGYEIYKHWDQVLGVFRSLNREWAGPGWHLPKSLGGGSTGHMVMIGNRPIWRNDPAPEAQGGYYTHIGYRPIFHPGAAPVPTIGSEQNQPQKVETSSRITIGFENAPPSLRVRKVDSSLGTDIRTELGYLLGATP